MHKLLIFCIIDAFIDKKQYISIFFCKKMGICYYTVGYKLQIWSIFYESANNLKGCVILVPKNNL